MLDVSAALENSEKEVLIRVFEVFDELSLSFILVGAGARDLLYKYKYGIQPGRATEDSDFAVQIESWDEFHKLSDAFVSKGFRVDEGRHHRFYSPQGRMVDIVPFGNIEDENNLISWPPDNSFQMSVLGFKEALGKAERVLVSNEPAIEINVVSVPALAALKIVAWTDREPDKKIKDASDFLFFLNTHETVLGEDLYERIDLLEAYDGDIVFCAAHVLGEEVGELLTNKLRGYLISFYRGEIEHRNMEVFIEDINRNGYANDYERNENLAKAFFRGLGI